MHKSAITRQMKKLTLLIGFFAIVGCGNEDGAISEPFTISNSAPIIINLPSEIEVDELQLSVISVSAIDPDGDYLRYLLTGDDPGYFNISGSGEITFREEPIYEIKNLYSINVNVSDNIDTTSQTISIYLLKVCTNTLIGFSVCYGEENTTSFYDRDEDYPTWKDSDGDCQNNRHEVLISEHIDDDPLYPLTFTDNNQCSVASGKWYDPYDDVYYYSASNVHIDHVVPLYDAHKSGAWYFPELKKIRFANTLDVPEQLMAVGASSNLSKSSWDPSGWYTTPGWKPNNRTYHCQYLQDWVKIKSIYRLNIDSAERAAIEKVYLESSCS